jgi:hypothetical protein
MGRRRHCVRPDFADEPQLMSALDEMARRYGRLPGDFVAAPDMHPTERQWFNLFMARAGCDSAAGRRRQFAQQHGDKVMLCAMAPGE